MLCVYVCLGPPEVPPPTNLKKLNWWSNTERFSWGIGPSPGMREISMYVCLKHPRLYVCLKPLSMYVCLRPVSMYVCLRYLSMYVCPQACMYASNIHTFLSKISHKSYQQSTNKHVCTFENPHFCHRKSNIYAQTYKLKIACFKKWKYDLSMYVCLKTLMFVMGNETYTLKHTRLIIVKKSKNAG